jgi:single-strand DNA-binding protein
MAGETIITVIGNLTGDPELRFTPSGAAVANLTIASTPRQFDRDANEFKDGDTLFMRGSIWREAAENVAESLTKGMRVVATGRLVQRSYETNEGERRTVVELQIDEIGPSLRYASAKVTRKASAPKGAVEGAEAVPAQKAAAAKATRPRRSGRRRTCGGLGRVLIHRTPQRRSAHTPGLAAALAYPVKEPQ